MFSKIYLKKTLICSSCWAFATVATLEAFYYKKTGKLVPFSEQDIVDCMYPPSGGCNGGWMPTAYDFIKQRGGIDTQATYPVNLVNLILKLSSNFQKLF